jgi:subtilisin family serine protease
MKIFYVLCYLFIRLSTMISCNCQDLIIKVKYLGEADLSISIKQNISIIIKQITDSFKIQEFNTFKKDHHDSIYIVSLPVMLNSSQIDYIENSILTDKSKEIKHIKMIKNNKINEETFFSNEIEENLIHRDLEGNLRGNITTEIESPFIEAEYFYKKNITGQNISIAIFDSGINNVFSGCSNLKEVINFTDEENEDFNGHGTFISSIICKIAKNSNIYFFKVFNKNRKTFSSWLYQAIEKAISMDIKIFNFSFGGINFDDYLITSAIKKAVAKGIIIICAAGNDGPSYGTINYPGNLPYLITVGALQNNQLNISEISSRGPAIFNNVNSYIDKPELWAIGENIVRLN